MSFGSPLPSVTPGERERRARARATEPAIAPNQVWSAPDNDGEPGYRRLRVLAAHPDGGWIVQDVDSQMTRRDGNRPIIAIAEFNLRYVMTLEEEPYAG